MYLNKNVYNHLLENNIRKPQPNKGMHTSKGGCVNRSLRNINFNLGK